MKTFKSIAGINPCRTHPENWLIVIIPIMTMFLPSYGTGRDIPYVPVHYRNLSDHRIFAIPQQ